MPSGVKGPPVFEGAQKLQSLLAVDDEEIIHVLVGEILKDQQQEVIGVTRGEEALKSYQDANGAVKAVILDMSLPGMDGLAMFRKLGDLNPR